MVLKQVRLPKCIIRYIITKFCHNGQLQFLLLDRVKQKKFIDSNLSKYRSGFYQYPVYYCNKTLYSNTYQIGEKCIITGKFNHGLTNCYISEYFSAHPDLFVFKLNNTSISDRNILITIDIIATLQGTSNILQIPVFPENYVEIMENNKNALISVVQAEMTLIKLKYEKKKVKIILELI